MTVRLRADIVSDVGAVHGEAPRWHRVDRRLDWVDVGAGVLHRFDPRTGGDEAIPVGSPLGSFAPRSRGGFVLALEDGFALLDPASGACELVAPVAHAQGVPARLNDGTCDPHGCFWAGSMAYDCSPGFGVLYRLDAALRVTEVLDGVTISNGLDWSDDGRTLYFIDTLAGGSFYDCMTGICRPGVDAFDFDPDSGALSGRRRVVDVPLDFGAPAGMTLPDGMTLDVAGCLWVAVPGDGEVHRYSPAGELLAVLELPVACPTSVGFGGDDGRDLYVTTMTPHGAPGPDPRQPTLLWDRRENEGALFRCRIETAGQPARFFAG